MDKLKSIKGVAKNKIEKLKTALGKEKSETKKMLAIYKKGKRASKKEKEFANAQFRDLLKAVGLGILSAVPIPGGGLLIAAVTGIAKKKFDINILPSAFYEDYGHYPGQVDPKKDKLEGGWVTGDPTKAIEFSDMGDAKSVLDKANKTIEKERGVHVVIEELDESMIDQIPWLRKLKDKIFDKTHKKGLDNLSYEYAKTLAGMKMKKQRVQPMHIVHDIAKKYSNVSDRQLRDHINDLIQKGLMPKDLKADYDPMSKPFSFKEFVNQMQVNEKLSKNASQKDYIDDFIKSDAPQFKGKSKEKRIDMAVAAYKSKNEGAYGYEKQDPDIKGKDGTQPAKYHKGLSKDTKKKRDAHFQAKKDGPAPGDAGAKTKPSVHTKKFKQMYGESNKAIRNKAEKSGVSYSILKKVYDRGMAAYKGGHRPGTTPQQWALARVNSFLTGGGARKADADLWKQAKGQKEQVNEDGPCWPTHKQVGMKKKDGKTVPNCVPKEDKELNEWGEVEEAAEYQGRKVTLNKPFYTPDGPKKSAVYVKNEKGSVVIVRFGDKKMEIKRDDPGRRKNFRARHNCDNPGPKWKARYWSCKAW